MGERIFYCPKHGRVTEEDYEDVLWETFCPYCYAWYYGLVRKPMKRTGES